MLKIHIRVHTRHSSSSVVVSFATSWKRVCETPITDRWSIYWPILPHFRHIASFLLKQPSFHLPHHSTPNLLMFPWTKGKGKGRVLAIAPLTWVRLVTRSALQSRKWQLIGMSWWYRSALCGHPLPASANNWTRGLQPADIPPPQSATLGLHPVARNVLLIFHPAEGRRLSWPEHTVGYQLAQTMLLANDPRWESNRNLKVTSRNQPLDHVHLHRHVGVNNLPRDTCMACKNGAD